MNMGRIFCRLAKIAAIAVAAVPTLAPAFISSVSDHIGSIRGLVDADTGALVAEYAYDPYGVLLEEAGEKAGVCPFRFSSKYYDSETGLMYFGYRYYNPASTKWLTVDPLQERGGLNFTAYCGGDPVNNIDPWGMYTWSDFQNNYMTMDAWKFRGKVFVGTFVGAGKMLYGVGDTFYSLTGGAMYYYSGDRWESYRHQSERGSEIAGGISTFVAHPIQTTRGGIENWQEQVETALLEGDGSQVGESIGSVTMQGLVFGETVVNPGAKLLARAPGRLGSLAGKLTQPVIAFPTVESLFARIVPPKGIPYSGRIYRYELPERVDSTWQAHRYNIAANHRFSEPGRGAVYGATTEETALAEINHYKALRGRTLVSKQVDLGNVLNLTDEAVLRRMGVTLDQISSDSYAVSHWLGDWARQQGYQGILVPSARNIGGANLVVLGDL